MEIEQNVWSFTPEGEAVIIYTMRNRHGAEVRLTNFGAGIVSVSVPDREGQVEVVTLGYPDANGYMRDSACVGKVTGRYTGYIPYGKFSVDGKEYFLQRNDGQGHRNGGQKGFGSQIWESRVEVNRVVFTLFSPDGDQGYPGNLTAEVIYDWDDENILEVTFLAKTESATIVDLCVNPYFNLAGSQSGNAAEHILSVSHIDAVHDGYGLPIEFPDNSAEGTIAALVTDFGEKCLIFEGLTGKCKSELYCPNSGRVVTMSSSHPAVFVDPGIWLPGNMAYGRQLGVMDGIRLGGCALPVVAGVREPERLSPEDIYRHNTVYKFSVR